MPFSEHISATEIIHAVVEAQAIQQEQEEELEVFVHGVTMSQLEAAASSESQMAGTDLGTTLLRASETSNKRQKLLENLHTVSKEVLVASTIEDYERYGHLYNNTVLFPCTNSDLYIISLWNQFTAFAVQEGFIIKSEDIPGMIPGKLPRDVPEWIALWIMSR